MDEYISKHDVLQRIESDAMWNRPFGVLYDDIQDMPAEDIAPVRHGRIVKTTDRWATMHESCSECGSELPWKEYPNYCFNCGAKLDLEE